jgi:membrane protein
MLNSGVVYCMKIYQYILRVAIGAIKGFINDDCSYKASSLAFYTLFSIIPILAVAFGIAKGIGFEKYLETEITFRLLDQPLLAKQIIALSYSMLEHVHGGLIAIVGLLGLLWTALQLLSSIEYSLNSIWGIQIQRSYMRQFTDYFGMLILGLIFFVISSSLSILTIVQLNLASQKYTTVQFLSSYIRFLLHLFPIIINWLMFAFIYFFLPNTKVNWKNAFIAGIIAGTAYQIIEWTYIHFQIGVASYGAVYGSFATLPLFLVWVNLSWMIVLAGAEIAFELEMTPYGSPLKWKTANKSQIGFFIACYCTKNFLKDKSFVSALDLCNTLGTPLSAVQTLLKKLCQEGILTEGEADSYSLAKNPRDIRINEVQNALNESLLTTYYIKDSREFQNLELKWNEYENLIKTLPANLSLEEAIGLSI